MSVIVGRARVPHKKSLLEPLVVVNLCFDGRAGDARAEVAGKYTYTLYNVVEENLHATKVDDSSRDIAHRHTTEPRHVSIRRGILERTKIEGQTDIFSFFG